MKGNAVVEIRNAGKRYKRFSMNDVSLDVKEGLITGLIGANGAGKSTLIKLIMGMLLPDAGDIRVFGESVATREIEIKERIGYVADECRFYEHLTIGAMKSIYAPFYKQWDEAVFAKYLDRFELSPKAKIRSLSKGMKMKLNLAFALSHRADLLIMDEPTAGLDPVFRRELLDILAELRLDERKSILFSTHITTDLDRIADYIAFLDRGKLVFNESREKIFERYALVKAERELLDEDVRKAFVGIRETTGGFEALTDDRPSAERLFSGYARIERPTLEEIMFFTAKGAARHGHGH